VTAGKTMEVSVTYLSEPNCDSHHTSQDPRTEQLKDDLEKKDQEIDKLKKVISQWEVSHCRDTGTRL
jgi:hypothetical protein